VQFTWDLPTVLVPQQEAGRMRIIAAATRERLPELPAVATVVEQGFPTMVYSTWVGMLAPAATPRPVLERLNAANRQVLATAEAQRRLVSFGAKASGLPLEEYRSYLAAEIAKWRDVAQRANVRAE
jgi:tripartite-type tricarboxylate transporter receptor subunit TctC